jgi:hypothetical protein
MWLRQVKNNLTCSHELVTCFSTEIFDRWDRVSGLAECRLCGNDFSILVPANREEREEAHGYNKV